MCLYRYRVWHCGCEDRFLTKPCSYASVKGHVLHKDRERRDVSVKGTCPWNCPMRRSKTGKPGPDPLAHQPTYIAMGKFALGMLKEISKNLNEKDPELLKMIQESGMAMSGTTVTAAKDSNITPYTGGGQIESLHR